MTILVEQTAGIEQGSAPSAKAAGTLTPLVSPQALIPAFFVALPAILFYSILFRKALNVPFSSDYESLLDFLNHMAGLSGFSAKISYFLAAQFNEYKLFFGHALAWLQLVLFGHIDFRLLFALGNGFVLLLAVLLWKMFLPSEKNLASRLALFIPVSWLLFQLQYAEALNWATSSLFYVPALVFSLGTIYLLVRATRAAFYGALICLILAIASSGDGLLMIPIGALILAVDRRYARLVSWLAVSAGCVAAYAYRYNLLSSQSRLHHSVLSTVIRPRPLYLVAFMGNAIAFPLYGRIFILNVLLCLLLGIVVCVFFFAMARRGYIRKNPLISYCVLLLLLTAVGVAGLRSDLGLEESLNPRYGMYSALLLIFAWFAIVEEFLQHKRVPLRSNRIWLGAVAAAVLFSLIMDVGGWHYLTKRNYILVVGMAAYEHSTSPGPSVGPIVPIPNASPRFKELYREAPVILKQSMELGIYRPPVF